MIGETRQRLHHLDGRRFDPHLPAGDGAGVGNGPAVLVEIEIDDPAALGDDDDLGASVDGATDDGRETRA